MADLEVDHLTKSFGERKALAGATFSVPAGEVFGFVGSNGAGKTTAMRIILGVLEPDGGQVRWDGRPITLTDRQHIGYMPEERGLYPKMKVGDQLEYLAELHGLSASDAKSATDYWTNTLGIAERRNDEVQTLSLGNQQRVQLAAALVHSPSLLVLDEPFSGLDPVAVDVMSGVLRERADAGVPVIFSSHQLDLVERLCDRVGIISHGRMVAVGTINDLRRTKYPRWVVDGPPAEAWLPMVPGAQLIEIHGSRTVVETGLGERAIYDRTGFHGGEIKSDPDGQDVLKAALAAGPVHEFGPDRPTLTELFRDVVTEPPLTGAQVGSLMTVELMPEVDVPVATAGPTGAPAARASAISSFRAIWLVARREIRTRLATRTFRLVTAFLALGALAGVLAANHFGGNASPLAIGSTDEALTQTVQSVVHNSGVSATVGTVSNLLSGEAALRDGTLAALITPSTENEPFEVIVYQELNPQLQDLFDAMARESRFAQQIAALGGDPAAISADIAEAHAPVTNLEPPDEQNTAHFVVAYLTGMIMFISLMIGAQVVAQGVVEEKSSRVVEVLLATVKPWELMAGKVIGIGIAILLQIGLAVAVAAIAARVTGLLVGTGLQLGWTLLSALLWFLIGFATFAVLFAALGSLVSRQEEVSAVITPITMLMLLPYFLGLTVLPHDPHNTLATVLSFVPFFAPFLMPIRAALGVAPGWQVGAALGISLATLPLLTWLAGRIYRNAVLRTGARTKLRDALNLGR